MSLFQVHAAVIAINEAIDKGVADQTMTALANPNAMLRDTQETLAEEYQGQLSRAKKAKEDGVTDKVFWGEYEFIFVVLLFCTEACPVIQPMK